MKFSFINLYDRLILKRPALSLAVLLCIFSFFIYWAQYFRLDASADSLILEHDSDLRYFRKVDARYAMEEFLILAYTPKGDLFSPEEIDRLKNLRDDLKALERVSSVVTILDVPLVLSPPLPLKELKKGVHTLLSPETDWTLARKEFAGSPVYRHLLVNPDLSATALLISLKRNEADETTAARRIDLREKRYRKETLTAEEKKELKQLEHWYREYKDRAKEKRHQDIADLRSVMDMYRPHAKLFLGGAPMVVDDMITFIKSDIAIFGFGVLLLMVATLWFIFRRKRWIILPVICCFLSVLLMVGILGLVGWEVTVVSSNFISLQMIMSMSFSIHLIGCYLETLKDHPEWEHHRIIREAVAHIFLPSSFTCLTTIAGFASLLACDILPVKDFGWMMSAGLFISLGVTFLIMPIALRFMGKMDAASEGELGAPITKFFARLAKNSQKPILILSAVVAIVTTLGMYRLTVENSFIDYFRKSTEIYQGMKFIDENLGGTTPLDIVLTFPSAAETVKAAPVKAEVEDEFSLMDEEEGAPSNPRAYWFTTEKIATVEKVHDYLQKQEVSGKVMSLATVVKMMRRIQDVPLDNFDLALIFNEYPEQFRKILVDPYVSVENNETRLTVRMKDSMPTLHRDAFLKKVQQDLSVDLKLPKDQYRLTSFMVLYNNMLQSLFQSQINTTSLAIIPLLLMFVFVFKSLKTGIIAMIPNVISTTFVLGIMGWIGLPLDMMTITIVSISLGMGVEDTILYIHRFKEEIKQDYDYTAAMMRCHSSVGNSMLYTSVVVTLGFSILMLSNFIPTITFGLLTAVTMVIALSSSLTLLPTLIMLVKPFGKGPKAS